MIWIAVHSSALLVFTLIYLEGASSMYAGGILFVEAIVAFSWLVAAAGRSARRPANLVTGARLLIAVALLLLLVPATLPRGAAALIFIVVALAEGTDYVDGVLARRTGPTAFGARLDMETDAIFILALSLLLIRWYDLPGWVSISGLLRYALALPFLFLPEPAFPRAFSRFAKVACAAAAVLLIAATLPGADFAGATPVLLVLGPSVRRVLALVATTLLAVSFTWEALLRIAELSRVEEPARMRAGLIKSVLTYYGVPLRHFAIRRLYASLVRPGDLVFDIGAHVGNRVAALRSIGARVVAVEPQPHCARILRRQFGNDPEVHLVQAACGRTASRAELRISSSNPTLSTLSDEWMESIGRHYAAHRISWDRIVAVQTVTLDALVAEYGLPRFVKIDVEGFEHEVLAGLSHRVDVISFEFLPASPEPALRSIARLEELGGYEYTFSMVETMRFAGEWTSADEIAARLKAMPPTGRSGDVYARSVGR